MNLTNTEIREYGFQARESVETIAQNCGTIVDTFEGLLNDRAGLPWRGEFDGNYGRCHIRVGPNGEEKHYIFVIDGIFLDEFEQGDAVWIDLSFDQFNDQNKSKGIVEVSYGEASSLSPVKILGPNHPEREDGFYQKVGDIFD